MRILIQILVLLLLSSCAESQTADKASGFLEDIGDGIYVHHGEHLDIDTGYQGDICNLSVVVGSKGVAVIDTSGSFKVGKQLRAAIGEVTKLPILYVINTHVHPDHIFGNAAFVADQPQFVGHAKLGNAMQLREEGYAKLNEKYLGAEDTKGSDIVVPTLEVKDTLELGLGDRVLKVTAHSVAHTDTDVTVIDVKTQTLFTGDLLFIERTPVLEGDLKGLIATLDTLKTYEVKQVVPGHGPHTKDWVQAIDNAQRYLNVLLTDIRAAIENDVGLEEAMATAAAGEKDKWVLFDVANRRNVNILYPALEWE
ncbi:MAG: quinoprotein relay system zinc metallohydrolase 2 [Methylophilaceae bacterium]